MSLSVIMSERRRHCSARERMFENTSSGIDGEIPASGEYSIESLGCRIRFLLATRSKGAAKSEGAGPVGMEYRIVRYGRERQRGIDTIRGKPLPIVRDLAKRSVEQGLAERVEVVDLDNAIVFRWPQTPHAKI